jgi:hypothetical protein
MTFFVISSIYFLYKNKHMIATILLSFALLTRELTLPLYAAIILFFIIKKDFKKAGLYFLAIIPYAIWQIVIYLKFGTWPFIGSYFSIAKPFIGIINALFKTSYNIQVYLIDSIFLQYDVSYSTLQNIHKYFSSLPILFFAIFQLITAIIVFIKNRKISPHLLLLLSQIAIILSLRWYFFAGGEEIDTIGRYAILLFMFSILFYSKEKNNYGKFLKVLWWIGIILIILTSIDYFLLKIILFKPVFYIT